MLSEKWQKLKVSPGVRLASSSFGFERIKIALWRYYSLRKANAATTHSL